MSVQASLYYIPRQLLLSVAHTIPANMAFLSLATALLLALSSVFAHKCQDIVVPVSISAQNGNFNLTTPTTNIEVTNFILDAVQNGHNGTAEALLGYQTISGEYNIQTTFCQPDKGAGSTVQLLT